MKRESEDSVSRAMWRAMASGRANLEANAQQDAIVEEEERSTDALERSGGSLQPPEDVLPNDYATLVGWGLRLTIARAELVATTRTIRAAATSARRRAMVTRDESISIRDRCQNDPRM